MEVKKESFTAERVSPMGAIRGYGAVIRADGTLRKPDHRLPKHIFGHPLHDACTEIWETIAKDEAAVSWCWENGCLCLRVAYRPTVVTPEMAATAQRLLNEIRAPFADQIDWMQDKVWRNDPLAGVGWELENPQLSDDELRRMVDEINLFAETLVDVREKRPFAYCEQSGSYSELVVANTGSDWKQKGPLNFSSVQRYRQLVQDYACHSKIVCAREDKVAEYSKKYETYRTLIEEDLKGQLLGAGTDGYLLIIDGIPELYDLDDGDFALFKDSCEILKQHQASQ